MQELINEVQELYNWHKANNPVVDKSDICNEARVLLLWANKEDIEGDLQQLKMKGILYQTNEEGLGVVKSAMLYLKTIVNKE